MPGGWTRFWRSRHGMEYQSGDRSFVKSKLHELIEFIELSKLNEI